MKPRQFIEQLDEARLVAAIAAAERKSSGEIRVYVTHHKIEDALARAKIRFAKLGMEKTRRRNAVLIYFAPRSRKFAVVGDVAVHERCGETFWREVTAAMTPLLQAGRPTEAVEAAVKKIGALLAEHFPRRPDDRNELPDDIARD